MKRCVMLTVLLAAGWPVSATDWPQLQGNPSHTGYTADEPKPPFVVKWTRQLDQPTHTGAPPIVADGKVFVGTSWGNLLALDRNTGKTAWSYATNAPICGTPAFADGVVYVNSMDRHCHAVDARTAKRLWTLPTDAGIFAGPVVAPAEGKQAVFIAGRDGFVRAADAKTGKQLWKTPVGEMVMATPAYDSGVLYVGAGDNRVYAINADDGKVIWTSDKLPGMAIRDYWLVASQGVVICTTQLVLAAHGTYGELGKAIMTPFREEHHGQVLVQKELFPKIVEWYRAHPHQKTLHVLEAATGREKFVAPVIPVHGGACVGPLPTIAPDGFAYLMYANVQLRASGYAFPGKLDLSDGTLDPLIKGRYGVYKQGTTGWDLQPAPGTKLNRQSMFAVGFCVNDQMWGVSRGGNMLFCVRNPGWAGGEGGYSYIDLATGDDRWLTSDTRAIKRTTWEGRYGGSCHATASPIAVSGKQLFHKIIRNAIICFEGK